MHTFAVPNLQWPHLVPAMQAKSKRMTFILIMLKLNIKRQESAPGAYLSLRPNSEKCT